MLSRVLRRTLRVAPRRTLAVNAARVAAQRSMNTSAVKTLYTADATATGGRKDGRVKTDDGKIDLQLGFPKSMGGDGKCTNPEQLFAAGYSGCFHGALAFVHQKKGPLPAGTTVNIKVSLSEKLTLGADIKVTLPGMDRAAAEALVAEAHTVCPYSRATKGNIPVTLTVA